MAGEPGLPTLERVAIASLHGGADALAHGYGVGRLALQEAAQHGELGAQHVSIEDRAGQGGTRADFDAIGGIVQKYSRRVRHDRSRRRATGRIGLLHAPQRRFDRVTFHYDVGKRGDNFLLVSKTFAIFFERRPGHQQKCFFQSGKDALLAGPIALRSLIERRAGHNFLAQLLRRPAIKGRAPDVARFISI